MDRRQHTLELKVPPLIVTIVTAALMWMVSMAAPFFLFVMPAKEVITGVLVLTGTIMSGLGVASFRRAKTTVNPMTPESSSVLVDSGIYRLTRNPMYLGFLLWLLGWAVFLSNMLAFLFLPAFIVYMNRFQIEPEEKVLAATFGQPFVAYTTRVRRWV